jgi:PKD repeat protein
MKAGIGWALWLSALAVVLATGGCSKRAAQVKSATPTLVGAGAATTPAGTAEAEAAGEPEKPLIVIVEAEPDEGKAPLTVRFKSGREPQSGKPPIKFLWKFADGAESTEENPVHTFTKPGSYEVTLQATDATGDTDEDYVQIEVHGSED